MYNQPQGFQNQFAGNQGFVNSQYRGYETKYQPVGNVQSQYNQSLNQGAAFASGIAQQSFAANPYQNFQNQNAQSYHTANYRGDQPGHDAYLRADSTQPAQSQFGIGASNFGMNAQNYGAAQQSYAQNQFSTPQSYHTANYRGDQPGHDAYLRADSTQPAQSQYGIGNAAFGQSQYNTSYQAINQQPAFATQQQYGQFASPQSYHTANYRGNQQGHDAYLRADSTQPAQSQYGIGASSMSFGRMQF